MARAANKTGTDLSGMLGEIANLVERLFGEQLHLFATELRQEARKAGGAALSFAAGAGLLAGGAALTIPALVHLLHRTTKLPLWSCYALVAGAAGTAGMGLLAAGRAQARQVRLTELPQTSAALKENVTWLKEQLTPAAP